MMNVLQVWRLCGVDSVAGTPVGRCENGDEEENSLLDIGSLFWTFFFGSPLGMVGA